MTVFIKYQQDDGITGAFSGKCDARIIWGGDQAISNIRKLPIPERSREIAFADRYSLCVIDAGGVLLADKAALSRLAGKLVPAGVFNGNPFFLGEADDIFQP